MDKDIELYVYAGLTLLSTYTLFNDLTNHTAYIVWIMTIMHLLKK